jgi:hypothetical protein
VVVPSKHNTIEVRLAHLKDTVEATITIYIHQSGTWMHHTVCIGWMSLISLMINSWL